MKILFTLAQWVTRFNHLLAVVVACLVFIMVAVISFDVVCRYFFNAPTVWAMEFSTLLFGPYFMLAGAYVLHVGGHVSVDILSEHFPPRFKQVVDCAVYLIIICLCVMFTKISLPIAIEAWRGGETTFSSWNPVIWPLKATIPLALILVGLQACAEIIFTFSPAKAEAEDAAEVRL